MATPRVDVDAVDLATGQQMTGTYLDELAEWSAQLRYDDLPGPVVAKARECLVDYLCAAVAGAASDLAAPAFAALEADQVAGGSRVIGRSERASSSDAAFLNGLAGHALEIDDYYVVGFPLGHIGTVVVPACLAVTTPETDAAAFLAAVVVGYEVMIRVANALGPSHYGAGWHSTGTVGTFGAAAAAARLLGASPAQMTSALGLAGTQAAGMIESFSAHGKPLHAGRAASNGSTAARLARHGYLGSRTIMEGPLGLGRLASTTFRPELLTADLGDEFLTLQTSFKKYFCACFDTVDAALEARGRFDLTDPAAIDRIVIRTTADFARNQRGRAPGSLTGAKVSAEYCVATALLDGAFGLSSFADATSPGPKKSALMDRIVVVADDDISAQFLDGDYAVGFDVTYAGVAYRLHIDNTIGHFKNPLTPAELQDKVRTVVGATSDIDAERLWTASTTLGTSSSLADLYSVMWPD
jgi:2-methylcitrate dehydratase PrpD